VPGVGAEFGREFRFLQALWELDHALESASRAMKARFGVTGRERLFIRIVGQRPGISPGEVAEMLHVHRSSVTALLKRLERRRLVSRRLDASDARSYRLELAVAGQRINAMEEGTIEAGVRDALAASDPDAADSAALILVSVAQGLIQSTKRKRAGRRQSRSRRRT
jgi:DNA-binding MarR family transcriptional regulator